MFALDLRYEFAIAHVKPYLLRRSATVILILEK